MIGEGALRDAIEVDEATVVELIKVSAKEGRAGVARVAGRVIVQALTGSSVLAAGAEAAISRAFGAWVSESATLRLQQAEQQWHKEAARARELAQLTAWLRTEIEQAVIGARRLEEASADGHDERLVEVYYELFGQVLRTQGEAADRAERLEERVASIEQATYCALEVLRSRPSLPQDLDAQPDKRLAQLRALKKAAVHAGEPTEEIDRQIIERRRELRAVSVVHTGSRLYDSRFEIHERIGAGGFATVWTAYDHEDGKVVAVKVLHPQHAGDLTRRERFFRGARKMKELDHPGIVRVLLTRGRLEEPPYFVMEYLPGGDLRRRVLSGNWNRAEAAALLISVGEAIEHAHRRRFIHRDIKRANILHLMMAYRRSLTSI